MFSAFVHVKVHVCQGIGHFLRPFQEHETRAKRCKKQNAKDEEKKTKLKEFFCLLHIK